MAVTVVVTGITAAVTCSARTARVALEVPVLVTAWRGELPRGVRGVACDAPGRERDAGGEGDGQRRDRLLSVRALGPGEERKAGEHIPRRPAGIAGGVDPCGELPQFAVVRREDGVDLPERLLGAHIEVAPERGLLRRLDVGKDLRGGLRLEAG